MKKTGRFLTVIAMGIVASTLSARGSELHKPILKSDVPLMSLSDDLKSIPKVETPDGYVTTINKNDVLLADSGQRKVNLEEMLNRLFQQLNDLDAAQRVFVAKSQAVVDPQLLAGAQLISDRLYQIPSLQQTDGSTCAFHALKNALYVIMALRSSENQQQYLSAMTTDAGYQKFMGPWRVACDNDVQYVSSHPIENIILNRQNPVIPVDFLQAFPALAEAVLSVDHLRDLVDSHYVTQRVVDFFHQIVTSDRGQWGFVINVNPQGGHWVSFVVEKFSGKYRWYFMNSVSGGSGDTADQLIGFLDSLNSKKIDGLRFEYHNVKPLRSKFDDIDRSLEVLNYYDDDHRYEYKCSVVHFADKGLLDAAGISQSNYQKAIQALVDDKEPDFRDNFQKSLNGRTISLWGSKNGTDLFAVVEDRGTNVKPVDARIKQSREEYVKYQINRMAKAQGGNLDVLEKPILFKIFKNRRGKVELVKTVFEKLKNLVESPQLAQVIKQAADGRELLDGITSRMQTFWKTLQQKQSILGLSGDYSKQVIELFTTLKTQKLINEGDFLLLTLEQLN